MNSLNLSNFTYNPKQDYTLYEKLIVIGDKGVGKSSFIENFTTEKKGEKTNHQSK